jgi:hypothetical protein
VPNVGPHIYDVKIFGFTRSSIYIYDISRLRVKTHNPSKRAAADPCLTRRDHQDRQAVSTRSNTILKKTLSEQSVDSFAQDTTA